MKKEREKTIRLAIIVLAIVAIVNCYITANSKLSETKEPVSNPTDEAYEAESNSDAFGWLLALGIVAFEAGTFYWILQEEKKGHTFSIESE